MDSDECTNHSNNINTNIVVRGQGTTSRASHLDENFECSDTFFGRVSPIHYTMKELIQNVIGIELPTESQTSRLMKLVSVISDGSIINCLPCSDGFILPVPRVMALKYFAGYYEMLIDNDPKYKALFENQLVNLKQDMRSEMTELEQYIYDYVLLMSVEEFAAYAFHMVAPLCESFVRMRINDFKCAMNEVLAQITD